MMNLNQYVNANELILELSSYIDRLGSWLNETLRSVWLSVGLSLNRLGSMQLGLNALIMSSVDEGDWHCRPHLHLPALLAEGAG
jgi:hypothetical protein